MQFQLFASDMHYVSDALSIILVTLKIVNGFGLFDFNHDVLKYVDKVEYNPWQVSEEWIRQPLDHFSETNKTWKMRYFKRLDLWKPNGPIYVYITGALPAYSDNIDSHTLLICQLARETHGALFSSEHRFYGYSIPASVTLNRKSLKYLSSRQALADLAKLIKFIKSAPEFKSSKVVLVGGWYAGSLAAWARLLYPDLVDAAVASSAPVLAKKDIYESLETINDAFKEYGTPGCLQKIQGIFARYTELLKTSKGIEELKREKQVCNDTDMNVVENQQYLLRLQIHFFVIATQGGSQSTLKYVCDCLQTNSSLEVDPCLNSDYTCLNSDYSGYLADIKLLKQNTFFWMYQACTEFGHFQTTSSQKQPFGNNTPLEFYLKFCKVVYGEEFDEKRVDDGVARTNAMYGGITPNVTNVVFTHGDMDPWHRLGVLTDLSPAAPAIVTHGTSQCDILVQRERDSSVLTKDRKYVKTLIKKWIA